MIEHHDEKLSVRGSPDRLVFVAFYADCRHEVRPVTAGYRAALTYNLFVDSAARVPPRATGRPVDTLVDLVRGYFATPRGRARRADPRPCVAAADRPRVRRKGAATGSAQGAGVLTASVAARGPIIAVWPLECR